MQQNHVVRTLILPTVPRNFTLLSWTLWQENLTSFWSLKSDGLRDIIGLGVNPLVAAARS